MKNLIAISLLLLVVTAAVAGPAPPPPPPPLGIPVDGGALALLALGAVAAGYRIYRNRTVGGEQE